MECSTNSLYTYTNKLNSIKIGDVRNRSSLSLYTLKLVLKTQITGAVFVELTATYYTTSTTTTTTTNTTTTMTTTTTTTITTTTTTTSTTNTTTITTSSTKFLCCWATQYNQYNRWFIKSDHAWLIRFLFINILTGLYLFDPKLSWILSIISNITRD